MLSAYGISTSLGSYEILWDRLTGYDLVSRSARCQVYGDDGQVVEECWYMYSDIKAIGTCVGTGACSGIDTGGSIGTGTGTDTSVGAQGMDYYLTIDKLVRF